MLAAMLRQSSGGGSGGGGGGGSGSGGTKLSLGISRLSNSGLGSAGPAGAGPRGPGRVSREGSLSSDSPDAPASDPVYIMQLVSDVRKFADVLLQLKEVFNSKEHQDCLHHAAHERLGELLRVLKSIIGKHQSLNSVDILSTAGTVIATVKVFSPGHSLLRCPLSHTVFPSLTKNFPGKVSEEFSYSFKAIQPVRSHSSA